jgi:phosphoribosylformylglycinamidine synthase
MAKVKVCVLRTAGTNCDKETAFAFIKAGAEAELVHVNSLVRQDNSLDDYSILALPGGFSYGDDIASGKVFANELRCKLADSLRKFVSQGKLIIGICNGFQILVKSGLLPGGVNFTQETSLIINDSGKFEDRWVYLKVSGCQSVRVSKCVWTKGLPEIIYLPVAHGEGKFIAKDKGILERLEKKGQIVFKYCDERGVLAGYPYNPNGSMKSIAGICDETGRILGLMPHPERHVLYRQHPRWARRKDTSTGDGLKIFENGVKYARKN